MSITRSLVLGLAIFSGTGYLAGCASSQPTRTAGQTVDDAAVTTRVKAALAKDQGVGNAMDVNVTTFQGTVQLSGFVGSRDIADRAGQIARGVEGVRSVKNDIQVVAGGRPSSSAGTGSSAPAR